MDEEQAQRERQNREREEELRRVPVKKIDKSKWPSSVRPIAMSESDGLGIDSQGRLYWDGKPVEIIGQRLDLSRSQLVIAIVIAVATVFAAAGTIVQAGVAYHDWACKTGWPSFALCPEKTSPAMK